MSMWRGVAPSDRIRAAKGNKRSGHSDQCRRGKQSGRVIRVGMIRGATRRVERRGFRGAGKLLQDGHSAGHGRHHAYDHWCRVRGCVAPARQRRRRQPIDGAIHLASGSFGRQDLQAALRIWQTSSPCARVQCRRASWRYGIRPLVRRQSTKSIGSGPKPGRIGLIFGEIIKARRRARSDQTITKGMPQRRSRDRPSTKIPISKCVFRS